MKHKLVTIQVPMSLIFAVNLPDREVSEKTMAQRALQSVARAVKDGAFAELEFSSKVEGFDDFVVRADIDAGDQVLVLKVEDEGK